MANKSYAKVMVQRVTGREPQDLLRELYVERRHSQQEIADALGALGITVTRTTVGTWLTEFGITRDDRPAVAL